MRIRYSKKMKMTAVMLLFVFACQLLYPTVTMALTTGPSQPEVQGFEPVGTTDMVDMFSGSFVYNIPLLDVEGYPVNISYHGGVSMEQEASWVGLGWNINPGTINRTVRGLPDDFNGDSLLRDVSIKDEKTLRVGVGVAGELAGVGDPFLHLNLSFSGNVNISNYRGVSCDFDLGAGINVMGVASAGANVGVGSQTGASVDYNESGLLLMAPQLISKDMAWGIGLNPSIGGGYSTRTGVKDLDLSFSASIGYKGYSVGISSSDNIPIGVKNYVPVITNSSTMSSINGRIKVGVEVLGGYPYFNVNAMFSRLHYNNDASRIAYGYMYLQNASIDNSSILDFTRDKDGMFNKSMQYLPPPNMTYDIYSVSGQGTGGIFRPFRNDFGNVYDPYTTCSSTSNGGEVELGIGDLFEAGWDYKNSGTEITSGPWGDYQRSGTVSKGFTSKSPGSVYENVYFKQAGELTQVDSSYYAAIGNMTPITPDAVMNLPQTKPGSNTKRDPRANLIYFHTAKEDTVTGVGTNPNIVNYTANIFEGSVAGTAPVPQKINRIGTGNYQRKKDQISEIVQVQKDGRKYVYGIPAMNNVQREVTFTVDPNSSTNHINLNDGIVGFSSTDASSGNTKGRDNYYNSTVTTSYAHSYLLTSVLSTDYVDVTGNGPTDDDLGSFTKFNYSRTDSDYRWVAPYTANIDSAQYNPGFWSDPLDDKASFVCGSREQWNLHSIETKNFIAEFYTSLRQDAQGVIAPILNTPNASIYNGIKSSASNSYELDSIKLYNKHDRFIHGVNAVPIKTIFFVYSYSLCPGVPNSTGGSGKLTLERIFFRYGNSDKSMISPYQFGYGNNPSYSLSSKDRWGDYKPNNSTFTNYEFPYVNQNDPSNNAYASAWALNKIILPSGGVIHANYERNDYAFVQDKPVNEMFIVQGLGNSPAFAAGTQLYKDNNTPYLYAYFTRRTGSELPKLSFAQNYMGMNFQPNSPNCVYFNFNLGLTSSNKTFEQIKGYANVTDVGICSNNTAYGYVKFIPVTPTGGGANLNPVTYTALNVGRYNLPQIIFPGSDPNETDLHAMLAGLKESFNELLSIGKSPIVHMVKSGDGQNVNLAKSCIRLQSVGLNKKGGGQRISSLTFSDQWNTLAGGIEQAATYGKRYNYTVNDSVYGTISSGVASYEPLIGGDENPLRQPVPYVGQSAHNSWPPNDPVDLYQETPIGESLFPSAQVGYSQVTVTSIHADAGRSSQGVDQYQFYTARDFPAQVIATSINTNSTNHYDFFSQQNLLTATQGYTLIFNDMHGKPKKVEHDVYNPTSQTMQPVSYQVYNYRKNGNKLNNRVKCMIYNGTNMQVQYQQLGIEEDVTMDSRQKNEDTHNSTLNGNFNFFVLGIFPCPIPLSFTWGNENQNEFQSATVTKVVQQYGILDNVLSYNEGALTTMQNELFDPNTGQAVATSTTNEFMDKEYSMNIPAYWVYKGMSPSFSNILYKDTGSITIGVNHIGTLNIINTSPLVPGDQLLVSYLDGGVRRSTTAWVMGILPIYTSSTSMAFTCTGLNVLPRFPLNTPGWNVGSTLTGVSIQVINSGHTNMLNENAETYTSMDAPMNSSGALNTALTHLINLKAKTFADSNTAILHDYIASADTVNPFAIGERGVWRLYSEYSYITNRNYASVTARNSGLYNAASLFASPSGLPTSCYLSPFNYLAPSYTDPNWHVSRTVTKWSPYGKEVENIDAIGNYSTAVYGFNQELPMAIASNSQQGEVLSDGFEDYNLLQSTNNIMNYLYSPFNGFTTTSLPYPSPLYNMLDLSNNILPACYHYYPLVNAIVTSGFAHTGTNSLFVAECHPHPGGCGPLFHINIPINNYDYSSAVNNYNIYFPNSTYHGYSFSSANEYLPFMVDSGKQYILSCWVSSGLSGMTGKDSTDFYLQDSCGISVNGTAFYRMFKTSNVIDGWQQVQVKFLSGGTINQLILPGQFYIDDIRIFPAKANMKSFVYNPYSEKLMATLDENNFATFYEYDQEGNLVRVKKETTKGIMTTSESRSGNSK